MTQLITRGLIIDTPWIDLILAGEKTWELRTTGTNIREVIALIRKGSCRIVGITRIADVEGPMSRNRLIATRDRHCVPRAVIARGDCDKWPFAWVLKGTKEISEMPYPHPSGAVIWVSLPKRISKALASLRM